MGLDMYLYTKDSTDSTNQLGYWRKANAIHSWFVQNVQSGIDECEEFEVSRENLEKLRKTCQTVLDSLKMIPGQILHSTIYTQAGVERRFEPGLIVEDPSKAIELLPTTPGFFFGDTNYDEGYKRDLEQTIEICAKVVGQNDKVYYQSSW